MPLRNEAFSYAAVPLEDGPRKSIRIIELLPGGKSQIQCVLHAVSLNDSPYYEAISYFWGPPIFDCTIICNGRTLNITSSLHGALQRLRHPTQSRWLWADAICINQNSDPDALIERASQVGLMRDIYENAQQAIIWLGQAEKNSHQAIYILRQLAHHRSTIEAMGRPSFWSSEQLEQLGLGFKTNVVDGALGREWAAVQPFFDRPWFKRIWTVQEVAVARHAVIVCGDDEIPWTEVVSALEIGVSSRLLISQRALNPDTLDFFDPAHAAQLSHMQVLQRSPKYAGYNFDSLLSYLLWFRGRQATNPLDKVFALLGLVKHDQIAATMIPNYDMSVESLYTMLTRQLLENTGHLDVLSSPRGPQADLALPSWVVDWSNSSVSTMSLIGQSRFKYTATGSSRSSARFSQDHRVLELKGHVVDTVSAVVSALHKSHAFYAPPMTSWSKAFRDFSNTLDNLSHHQKVLIEWETLALGINKTAYRTGESMADVFQHTLRAGLPREYNMKASYEDWQHNAKPGNLTKSVNSTRHPWLFKGAVFLQVFQDAAGKVEEQEYPTMAYGRRLGMTRNGYLALLPAEARVGDIVVLCEGGKTPLILRSRGWAFELVGNSYVHGMMQGELFRPLELTAMNIV